MGNVIVVEGYSFTDENMAKQARTEAEGVRYVRPIPIADHLVVSDTRGISDRWSRRLEKEQNKLRMSMVANFAFVVSILLMFLITATSGQTTILNYEKKIQDRYAQWEQQLTQREKAIREEEQELELDFDTVLDDEEKKELQEFE